MLPRLGVADADVMTLSYGRLFENGKRTPGAPPKTSPSKR